MAIDTNKVAAPPLMAAISGTSGGVTKPWAIFFRDLYKRTSYEGGNSIGNNKTEIDVNKEAIAQIETDIDQNSLDIAANVLAIANNSINIAGNSSNIASNLALILANAAAILQNQNDIDQAESDITDNALAISVNSSGVAANAAAIVANSASIASNLALISQNTSDISTNALAISTHEALTTAHSSNGDIVGFNDLATETIDGLVKRLDLISNAINSNLAVVAVVGPAPVTYSQAHVQNLVNVANSNKTTINNLVVEFNSLIDVVNLILTESKAKGQMSNA